MRTTAMTKELASEFASDQMRELTETELNSVGGGYEDAYKITSMTKPSKTYVRGLCQKLT